MELFAASSSRVSHSEPTPEGSRPRSRGKPSDARARSKANGGKRVADAAPAARRAPKKSDGEATALSEGAPVEVALKRRGDGGGRPRVTAETLAARQREISVSEFFTKNRHLLGFDNPSKALLTTVKEAVDNSLDACEEAHILPEISVGIDEINETRFRVSVEDNGPGIVRQQVPKIFAKLLYGSKFHRLRQSLTWEQPVLVEREGRFERIAIGELVDGLLNESEEVRDVSGLRLRVPAFDPTTLEYAWRPVSHIIRHARENEILEVSTERGKKVRVTGCHSLFTFDPMTRKVREVAARELRTGDYVVAPRNLGEPQRVEFVNLLAELDEADLRGRWLYVYGVGSEIFSELRSTATVVRARCRSGRMRRYYRIARNGHGLVVLDDAFAVWERKRFLPAWVVKRLGLELECESCTLRTYHHGKICQTLVRWELTPELLRLLGLFVAEGHSDRRQVGFTFGAHESDLVREVADTAHALGMSSTIEQRERNAVRVKVFGGALDLLMPKWCGRGAHQKRVPWFVFHASRASRHAFLSGLYRGDGHAVPTRNHLMFGSVSRRLVADLESLWLLEGVLAGPLAPSRQRGLGRRPSTVYRLDVHGVDVAAAQVMQYRASRNAQSRYRMFPAALLGSATGTDDVRIAASPGSVLQAAGLGLGPAGFSLGELKSDLAAVRSFADCHLAFLRVDRVRRVRGKHPYVYDLSVPGCENFVAGEGPLACHNSRGQQGIGISAAGLYAQLTTGKPMVITSRTAKNKPAHRISVLIDTAKNQPKVLEDIEVEWDREHGTRVELELTGAFRGGRTSVDAYVEQTVVANPHVAFAYKPPKGEAQQFPRATESLPREPVEIKPHPHGVELGMLMRMLHDSRGQKAKGALVTNFSRVSPATAQAICEKAGVSPNATATSLDGEQIERLHKALGETKVMAPPSSAVVPIGEDLVIAGLKRRYQAEIFEATTRPPAVYRGNPFIVECGIAYGGELPLEEPAELMRFANRVPLQYQPGACAITAAVQETKWRNYTLQQPKGGLPVAPMAIFVHLASVWVPFTSEAKEAIAHYDEILREIQRALQECGRKLATKLRARDRADSEAKRRSLFERYIPELGQSIGTITGRAPSGVEKIFFSALPKFLRVAEVAELAAAKARGEPEPPKRRRGAEREEAESEPTPQTLAPPATPPSGASRETPKTNAEGDVAKAATGTKGAKKKRRK